MTEEVPGAPSADWALPPDTRRVHFVGIGGVGMSGIAELMNGLGYQVTGSDAVASATTARLLALGLDVSIGNDAGRVAPAHVVVASAAIPDDHPELVEARQRSVSIVRRGVMLAGLTRGKTTVAVTGTHGKSTTSSMVALMLTHCGLDPTVMVGARVGAFESNCRLGRGPYWVVEADESEPSLLELVPQVAVLTNLEAEHLDHYGTFSSLRETVARCGNRVVEGGAVVVCDDDLELRRMRSEFTGRVLTYGLSTRTATVCAEETVFAAAGSQCLVKFDHPSHRGSSRLRVPVPGRHNLLNALAAFTVGLELGLEPEHIAEALAAYSGVDRRFQELGVVHGIRVVDDYGHHPTELRTVFQTAREQPHQRVVAVFQPHRFTRTAQFLDGFAQVLASADVVVLADIFPAGEVPIPGVSADHLAGRIQEFTGQQVYRAGSLDGVVNLVAQLARSGDLVLTLGAGSIGTVGARLVEALKQRSDGTVPDVREET